MLPQRYNGKDYVRAYRESRGWTQSESGQKLNGLTRQRISDIERATAYINRYSKKACTDF
jgi:transcriptional regulator with XRE-family HTH domain